jgi:hypothetical protein
MYALSIVSPHVRLSPRPEGKRVAPVAGGSTVVD